MWFPCKVVPETGKEVFVSWSGVLMRRVTTVDGADTRRVVEQSPDGDGGAVVAVAVADQRVRQPLGEGVVDGELALGLQLEDTAETNVLVMLPIRYFVVGSIGVEEPCVPDPAAM